MDDALVVEVPRPQQDLVHEAPHQVFPEHAELLQHARDRAARDVLEEDVEVPDSAVGAAVADDVPACGSSDTPIPRSPIPVKFRRQRCCCLPFSQKRGGETNAQLLHIDLYLYLEYLCMRRYVSIYLLLY